MSRHIAQFLLDEHKHRELLPADVMEELRKAMTSFGFMIIQTLVTDIEPDMKVRAAMNEINAAQRLRYANLTSAISPFTNDPLSANVRIPQRSQNL